MRAHDKPIVFHAHGMLTELHAVIADDACRDEVDLLRAAATHLRKLKRKHPDLELAGLNVTYDDNGEPSSLHMFTTRYAPS